MRIGVVSDLHYEAQPPRVRAAINPYDAPGLERRLADAVDRFDAAAVELLLLLGDATELGSEVELEHVFGLLARAGAPVAAVAGNHEPADRAVLRRAAAAAGVRLLADAPLALDGIAVSGVEVRPVEPGLPIFEAEPPAPAAAPVHVVASHFPVLSQARLVTAAGLPYYGDLVNRAEVEARLAGGAAPAVVLNGHIHSRCSATRGPVLQLSVGALIEPPFDCTLVDVTVADGSVEVCRTAAGLGPPARITPVFAPEDERWRWDGSGWTPSAYATGTG